jgi:thioredoxin-related protein
MTKHMALISTLLLALPGACAGLAAEESLWATDFNAALDQAERDGKDLLIDFTGSDWCPWCLKLKEEVFSQPAFIAQAPKQFVLVELDFPRSKPVAAANQMLQREFMVQGFPTIVLADSKGRAYARTGYREGGAEKYLAHLAELRKSKAERDELFARAAQAQGPEKARLLDQALMRLENDGALVGYGEEVKQILAADADNKAGLKKKYEGRARIAEIEKTLMGARDFKAAVEKVDAFLKEMDPAPESRQYALYLKGAAQATLGQREQALGTFQAAIDADPLTEAAQEIAKVVERVKSAGQAPQEKDENP